VSLCGGLPEVESPVATVRTTAVALVPSRVDRSRYATTQVSSLLVGASLVARGASGPSNEIESAALSCWVAGGPAIPECIRRGSRASGRCQLHKQR
jgi:hypothetical protein